MSEGTALVTAVVIRGVGASSRNSGFDSRVGVYLDGVYLGQSPAINQSLVDIERVEVLRGPQGALFGKNTVAGAINLVTAKPGDDFSAYANVRYGNYDAWRSEEHTSELQSLMRISYAVFCLKKKRTKTENEKQNRIYQEPST